MGKEVHADRFLTLLSKANGSIGFFHAFSDMEQAICPYTEVGSRNWLVLGEGEGP